MKLYLLLEISIRTTQMEVECNAQLYESTCRVSVSQLVYLYVFTELFHEEDPSLIGDLCCLMTPGLSKDIKCHMTILLLNLQITRSDVRTHIKWAVSLVNVYGRFYLLLGFVRVCMG